MMLFKRNKSDSSQVRAVRNIAKMGYFDEAKRLLDTGREIRIPYNSPLYMLKMIKLVQSLRENKTNATQFFEIAKKYRVIASEQKDGSLDQFKYNRLAREFEVSAIGYKMKTMECVRLRTEYEKELEEETWEILPDIRFS
jgi:hypothetical protein